MGNFQFSFTKNKPIALTTSPDTNKNSVIPSGPLEVGLLIMQIPIKNRLAKMSIIPSKITLRLFISVLLLKGINSNILELAVFVSDKLEFILFLPNYQEYNQKHHTSARKSDSPYIQK